MTAPWLTVVTTTSRPHYLQATLDSIDRNGGATFPGEKHLYVDGHLEGWSPPTLPPSWTIYPWGEWGEGWPRGNAYNTINVLRLAAAERVPYLLYFEDDIALTRNAVSVMEDLIVPPDCFALQFCDLKQHGDPRNDKLRLLRQPIGDDESNTFDLTRPGPMWGLQALKFHPMFLRAFAQAKAPTLWARMHHSDILLSRVAVETAFPYLGIVSPSLVQHIGLKSMVNPGDGLTRRGRAAHNFPGENFDARSLTWS